MWRMQSGNRVLDDAEWACFCEGLGYLRDQIEFDLSSDSNDTETGIRIFDRLSSEQKLTLLADVGSALHDPAIPAPRHNAANEGVIAAVLRTFEFLLGLELEQASCQDPSEPINFDIRRLLLAVFADMPDSEDLPSESETDEDEWFALMESFENMILWDHDYAMADDLLDLPPEVMKASLKQLAIDRDYFVSVPRDPNELELIKVRQTLARFLGLPVTDDEGFYPFLDDHFHGVTVGPCSTIEIDQWDNHPWIQVAYCNWPSWDLRYEEWLLHCSHALPAAAFSICCDPTVEDVHFAKDITVEPFQSKWVIRNHDIGLWSGLIENCWTDCPDDDDLPLMFDTPDEARLAYAQAIRLYGDRLARRRAIYQKLGRVDPDENAE